MLISSVAWLVAFWNYKMFDNYMVSRLYRIRKKDSEQPQQLWSSYMDKADPMVPRALHNPREYCKELLMWPCCKNLRCFKSDRVEKSFEVGRTYLSRETNIVSIVKSVRYFKQALKLLLSEEQRTKLKEKTKYLTVDPYDLKPQKKK